MTDPHVLFVVLDSVRSDRVSTYGHDRSTTPVLDALASEATIFENAYAPAPWTLPSHSSMFTGLAPSEHGVTNGFTDGPLRLADETPTLAEVLAKRGYATAGFSNNPWVGDLSGLSRGFDEFVEWDLEISHAGADGSRRNGDRIHRTRDQLYSRGHAVLGHAVRHPAYLLKRRFFTSNLVERATRWLSSTRQPTFTFLNLMEAHSPYYPPSSAFRALDLPTPGPLEPRILNMRLLASIMGKSPLGEHRERILEYYDASLRYQDRKLAELIAAAKRAGTYDDTLLIVCSDHGKTLGEFDREEVPPHYLRDINVNVPLLIKRPGQREGERVDEPFELADLFDVALGDSAPVDAATGDPALVEDFVPHTGRSASAVARWRALCDGDGAYVRSEEGDEYLLSGRGPGQRIVEADAGRLDERRRELSRRTEGMAVEGAAVDGDGKLGTHVEAQLEDLGYLG